MLPYLTPSCVETKPSNIDVTRKADKTGLIAWQSNKYSVPMVYQNTRVGVVSREGQLLISDLATEEVIAEHHLCLEKGQVIKNTDHYRDKAQRIESLEADIQDLLAHTDSSQALCQLLKATSPKIYKDQLAGAKQVLTAYCNQYGAIEQKLLAQLIDTSRLTATGLRERLTAYQQHPERNMADASPMPPAAQENPTSANESLARYGALNGQSSGQGESHANPLRALPRNAVAYV